MKRKICKIPTMTPKEIKMLFNPFSQIYSIFTCILLLLMLYQCKKGAAEFTLKGSISDQTLNTGLTEATIQLYKVPPGSTEKILVESKLIADDGSYSFTFQREAMFLECNCCSDLSLG